jgi:erythromycin esterase
MRNLIVWLTRFFRAHRYGFSADVIFPCFIASMIMVSCDDKNEIPEPTPVVVDLVSPLKEEFHPMGLGPLQWSDDEIQATASFSEKSVVALGEATHGTAEFFDAKHRVFRHLVEREGFRVFAIEADFGESVILNKAIQESRTSDIKPLMLSTMLFWTWKTAEVQAMLEWMSEYNRGKPAEDKLQYMGVDCQANVNNAPLVFDYLQSAGMPFLSWADSLLEVCKTATLYNFKFHTEESYVAYIKELSSLQDSISH